MRRCATLARLTAIEVIRQPVCLLLTVSCITLIALTPLVLLHHFGEDGKVARDGGLACHLIFGILMVGYSSCSALSREIKNGTASLLLTKPISRHAYFFSKFLGLLLAVFAFSFCATLATLIAERVSEHRAYGVGHSHEPRIDWIGGNLLVASPFVAMLIAGALNYKRKCSFQASAYFLVMGLLVVVFLACGFWDRFARLGGYDLLIDWRILPASLLVTLALCMFAALALSLSTRLATTPTLVVCVLLLLGGLLLDYVLSEFTFSAGFAAALRGVVPNWQHFWRADNLIGQGVITWGYVAVAFVYASVYSVAALMLGLVSFSNVDLK